MWVWHHSFCPSYHPQNGSFTTVKGKTFYNSADSCTSDLHIMQKPLAFNVLSMMLVDFHRPSNLLQRGLKLPRKLGLANGKNQTSISFSTLRPLHVTLFVHSILERVMRKRFIRCVFFKKDIFFWLFRSKNNLPLQDAFVCPSTGYENWGLFFLRFSTVE